eukprot:scaffold127587_cov72-Phaeocystis_antarctica.AAC.4
MRVRGDDEGAHLGNLLAAREQVHADVARVLLCLVKDGEADEVLVEPRWRGPEPIALRRPQPHLVDDCLGQYGRQRGHERVRVALEEVDDLLRADAAVHGAQHALARDLRHDQVRQLIEQLRKLADDLHLGGRRRGIGDFGRASRPHRSVPSGAERLRGSSRVRGAASSLESQAPGGRGGELWYCPDGAFDVLLHPQRRVRVRVEAEVGLEHEEAPLARPRLGVRSAGEQSDRERRGVVASRIELAHVHEAKCDEVPQHDYLRRAQVWDFGRVGDTLLKEP